MTLNSETVLDNWCPEIVYDYAQQNDIDLTLSQAYLLIQSNPEPPYGWLVARDMLDSSDASTNETSNIGPYLYWCAGDAEEDANIYREDGYANVFITREVDHETMCSFLVNFSDEFLCKSSHKDSESK